MLSGGFPHRKFGTLGLDAQWSEGQPDELLAPFENSELQALVLNGHGAGPMGFSHRKFGEM